MTEEKVDETPFGIRLLTETYQPIRRQIYVGPLPDSPEMVSHLAETLEVTTFISLEIPDYQIVTEAFFAGIEIIPLPVQDFGTPPDIVFMNSITNIAVCSRRYSNVYIHCYSGRGRTGMVAACLLVYFGYTAEAALEKVRDILGDRAPETEEQVDYVREYEQYLLSFKKGN